jgi:PAS domain-containing protein
MVESKVALEDERALGWEAGRAMRWAEMTLDEDNRIVSVNDIFTDITQYEWDEVRGHTPIIIRPPGIEPTDFMKFWSDILTESRWQGTVWYRRRDGYLFRSRQQVTADSEMRGRAGCHVRFCEIKIP